MVTFPVEQPVRLRLGDPRLPNSAIQFFHYFPRMVAFVRNDLRRSRAYRRTTDVGKILPGGFERLADRRRVPLVGLVDIGGDNRSGVQVHGVFGLVGEVGAAILHLGNPRVLVALRLPVLVRKLFALALAIHAGQLFTGRRLDPAVLGDALKHLLVRFSCIPAHDRTHGRVGFHGRSIDTKALPNYQAGLGQRLQHPAEYFLMDFQGQPLADSAQAGVVRNPLGQGES